jgi:Kinetochore CENP-C fungal homologue, Mif2, N-terminal
MLEFGEGRFRLRVVYHHHKLTLDRKTGLTVPDSGIRDEYGLEPMDDLFSSPNKEPKSSKVNRKSAGKTANATISSEEDMDMGESKTSSPGLHIAGGKPKILVLEADKWARDRHYSRTYSSLDRKEKIKHTNAPTKIQITNQDIPAVSRS